MVKRLTALLLAIVMVVAFTACAAPEEQPEDSTAPAEGDTSEAATGETTADMPESIEFLTAQAKFFEEYQPVIAEAIEAEHGTVTEFQVVPDNEYYSLVKVKLSTGEVPDIFEYNLPTTNRQLEVQKYCVPMDDQPWVSRLINPDLIKDADDGLIYAQPKESSSGYLGVYYNKAILEEAGYTGDIQPQTYQEFLDMLEAIKTNVPDATPIYMSNADTWTTQIFMTGGFSVALDDRVTEVADYLGLFSAGYVNEDHLSAGFDNAPAAMGAGNVAMYLTIENFANSMSSQYPEIELGSMIIPFNDNVKMPIGQYVQGLFVPNAGSQIEETLNYINQWSQPEYQDQHYAQSPGFSAFSDVNGGEVNHALKHLVDTYVGSGDYVYQFNDPAGAASLTFADLWNLYIEAISGTKTPDEVFEAYQIIFEDYMTQQGQEGF